MEPKKKNGIRSILHDWRFLLACITYLAIFVRALPMLLYPAWGSDLGIYYGITNDFISTGQFYTPYTGWGSSYNYFPILYVIAGSIHYLTGVEPMTALLVIGPIFGGLCATIIFFISRSINLSIKASLASAIIIAVFPLHAYQTSHSAPLVMGHFFLLLSLFFFIRSHENRSYIGPLYVSTFLLIMSHHFSTYIYILAVIFIIFWQNLHSDKWTKNLKEYIFYIFFTLALTFAYWGFIAWPVYQNFMDNATPFKNWMVVALCYILFIASLGVVVVKRKYAPELFTHKTSELPLDFSKDHIKITVYSALSFIVGCIGGYVIMGFLSLSYILWAIPISIIFGFAAVGWSHTKRGYVHGWTVAILLSGLYGVLSSTRTLFPERHMEYLAEPLSILAGLGLVNVTIESGKYKKAPAAIFITVLIAVNITSVSFIYTSSTFARDAITEADLNSMDWMVENVANGSVVASDHVLSMLLHSKNYTRCNDFIYDIWTQENWRDAMGDLEPRNESIPYERIEYILVDNMMFDKGIITTAGTGVSAYAEPIFFTNDSYGKFGEQPFELIYRNCSYIGDEETIIELVSRGNSPIDYMDITSDEMMAKVQSWAEIYRVNWTYIDDYWFNNHFGSTNNG